MLSSDSMFPKKAGEHGKNTSYSGKKFKDDAEGFKAQINRGRGDTISPKIKGK